MMTSWWELGEGYGQFGSELALYLITCPFCDERGNFERAFHAEKKKPNGSKKLSFDVYKCANCAGYVHVLWSATSGFHRRGLHDFRVLPYPLRIDQAPEHWPERLKELWLQAVRSIASENWDAAAVMVRSALQFALRENKAEGKTLKDEIRDLAAQGLLPPMMKEWSDNLRFLGNESAHPAVDSTSPDPQDVRDAQGFLDFLLEYLYDLPDRIKKYRERKSSSE